MFNDTQASIYITNLGKYTEGDLVGEWLNVPCSKEDFNKALNNIGVDGVRYEEYFLTDWENISGIGEHSNYDEINTIAKLNEITNIKIDDTIDNTHRVFNKDKEFIRNAITEYTKELEEHEEMETEEIIDRINSLQIFTDYTTENCNALESFGYYILEELNFLNYNELDDKVQQYIDVEKYARTHMHSSIVIDCKKIGKYNDVTVIIADI
ncbi:antirestriction protein ArdA [Staphylococcus gallinarum]|uniref:antirestriction protein ArdA n=1 Tax=Staphylococcus gallinarum TaxID=1293 RepID=UPI0030C56AD3